MEPDRQEAPSWAGGLKIFFGVLLAAPLIALSAALFILAAVPDLDVIRREAEAQIHENLGLTVQFEDRFSVTFFPSFGISTGRVTLNVPGTWPAPLVAVDELVMSMDLAPLLADRVVITKAIAIGLKINLHQPRGGAANWDVLLKTLQEKSGRASPDGEAAAGGGFGSNMALEVERLVFRDAGVTLNDEANGHHFEISDLDVEAEDMRINAPIFFTSSFAFAVRQPEIQGKVSTAGQFQLDIARARYSLSGMALRLVASGPAIPPAFGRPEFTGLVSYDRLSQVANLRRFSLTSKIAKVTGDLMIRDPAGRPEFHGDVNFTMPDLLALFDADGERRRRHPVTAAGTFDMSEGHLQADNLRLTLDGKAIKGNMEARFDGKPTAQFKLTGGAFDLRQLLADIKTLPVIAKPDGAPADRPFAVPDGLPPAEHIAHVIATLGEALQPLRDAFAALGKIPDWGGIEGSFELAELVLPEAKLVGVKATVHAGEGVVTGRMEVAEVAGGSARFDLKVTPLPDGGVALNLASRLDNVDSSRLLLGLPDHFGKVKIHGDFQASGASPEDMLRGASGFVEVSLRRPDGLISLPLVPALPPFTPTRADFRLRIAPAEATGGPRRHDITVLARLQDGPTNRSVAVKLHALIEFRSIDDGGPALGVIILNGALLNGIRQGVPRILGLKSRLRLDLAGEQIHIDELRLLLDEQSVQFAGTIGAVFADIPKIKGRVVVARLDLPALARFADHLLPDIAPLARIPVIAGQAEFEFGPKSISVEFKSLNLDENRLRGTIRFKPGSPGELFFDLAGGDFDLNRYLPPPADGAAAGAEAKAPADGGRALEGRKLFQGIEKMPLDEFQMQGKVTFRSLKWRDHLLRDVLIRSRYRDRELTVNPFRIGLFGGNVSGRLGVNLRLSSPVLNADLTVKNWRLERLLALAGRDPREITGSLDIRFRGKARGRTIKRFKQTLTGRAAFKVKDMVIVRGGGDETGAGKGKGANEIEITLSSGRFEILNGEFLNNDLRIIAPKISAWGRGRFHIVEDTIDYALRVTYSDTLSVPVNVSGKLSDPEIDADIAKVLGGGTGGLLDLPFRILDPIIKPLLR